MLKLVSAAEVVGTAGGDYGAPCEKQKTILRRTNPTDALSIEIDAFRAPSKSLVHNQKSHLQP